MFRGTVPRLVCDFLSVVSDIDKHGRIVVVAFVSPGHTFLAGFGIADQVEVLTQDFRRRDA